jgi:hypothetical protein
MVVRSYRIPKKDVLPSNGLKTRVFAIREELKAAHVHKYVSAMEAVDPSLTEHRAEIANWFNGDGPVPIERLFILERLEAAAATIVARAIPKPEAEKRETANHALSNRVDTVFSALEAAGFRQPVRALAGVSPGVSAGRVLVSRWKRHESRPTARDAALVDDVEKASALLKSLKS